MRRLEPLNLMFNAVESGDVSALALLLSDHYSSEILNKTNEDGLTLLLEAASQASSEVVSLLLEAGASVQAVNKSGRTPLHVASSNGFYDTVCMLIHAGADVNTLDDNQSTPLHNTAFHGHKSVVKVLLDAGADANAKDEDGWTPLHYAADNGYSGIVRLLIEAGADVNLVDENGNTPLHLSSEGGHYEVVKMITDAGGDPSLRNNEQKSAVQLSLAITNVCTCSVSVRKLLKLLTAAGAIVNGATATISPLVPFDVIRAIVPEDTHFWLAANNDAPMLAADLAGGLDPNTKTENGMTLLHWACAGDAPECVQLLLDAGADKEARILVEKTDFDENDSDDSDSGSNGFILDIEDDISTRVSQTPIFYCMHESADSVKNMINYGADVNQLSGSYFPIHFALAANSPACVTALVGAGAWVTQEEMNDDELYSHLQAALTMHPAPVDALRALLAAAGERVLNEKIFGMPPLYWAVDCSTVDGVRTLVECGVSLADQFDLFRSALEFAEDNLTHASSSDLPRISAIVQYIKQCLEKQG